MEGGGGGVHVGWLWPMTYDTMHIYFRRYDLKILA